MVSKPFSQACENNKEPILAVLRQHFHTSKRVLEIGSGTGQHAVYFSSAMPDLIWQPTDRAENLPGINAWIGETNPKNICRPQILDVMQTVWPTDFDAVFSANTAHIMSWTTAAHMITEVGHRLPADGVFALYGPFNYEGRYTSESNREFDRYLKTINAEQGIRDFEAVNATAANAGLGLAKDYAMPANNRLIIWCKR